MKFKYSFEEMNSKMEDIREYSKKYENFISFLPENYHNQMNNKNFLHNCGLGWKTMTIGPDGKVRPCVMCNDGVFNWGNVITDSFENILKNPLVETLSKANLPNSKTCERCQCKLFCMYCIYRAVIINVDRINKGLGYCEWARENIDIFDYINNNAVMSKCINKQIDSLLG